MLLDKPWQYDAKKAHKEGVVLYTENGDAIIKIDGVNIVVPKDHQYDLTQATVFGLNERLTMSATSPVLNKEGLTLRDKFNDEWENYTEAISAADGFKFDYGVYVYYKNRNDLVRYSPQYWHSVVAVASSSTLISDFEQKMSWQEIRNVLEKTTVGVAGCSVGSNVVHSTVMDLRPFNIKIADKSLFKMENINRVRLTYWDIVNTNLVKNNVMNIGLKSKSNSLADQIYAIDPFINIYSYAEGLIEDNIEQFFLGGDNEPEIDIVVEEVDDPRMKLYIREQARKYKKPLVMVTDAGSNVQLDVCRYDLDPSLPLTYGTSDKVLYEKMEAVYDNPGNRKYFFDFVDALIGTDYKSGELKEIIEEKREIPTSTIIPQLGSTAAMSGAVAAETIARIRLGHNYPSRSFFNKHTFKTVIYK